MFVFHENKSFFRQTISFRIVLNASTSVAFQDKFPTVRNDCATYQHRAIGK